MNSLSPLILTYGGSASGKTVDCGYSFPKALFLGNPNGLQSITLYLWVHSCLNGHKNYRRSNSDYPKCKSTRALRLLSLTISLSLLNSLSLSLDRIKNTQQRWGKLRDVTLEFRNAARYAGITIVLNCWEKAPQTKSCGTFVRGGPMLSGKLPEQLPAMCDIVLKCGRDPQRKPWGGIYKCEHSSQYIMKDRYGIAYALHPCPMNLAEILRSAGVTVSRMEGLEWQEDVVETFSQELGTSKSTTNSTSQVETLFGRLLSEGIDPKFARWTIRDVIDRVVIRNALNQSSQRFFA